MMRKNWLVLLVLVLFAFSLSACGKKETLPPPSDIDQATEPVTEAPPPVVEEQPVVQEKPVTERMPVVEDVFFEFDKFSLTSDARRVLENNARQLKDASGSNITIEGHCDERGTNAYNLALGEKRAKAAKDYLVSLGVSGSRIRTVSMGEERPFDMGHNEAAWAKNRRAHFVINK